ncbi:MAG TPA: hypothetical protein DDY78_14795 [Planctomycetales bacterium]|nr:hypothetical protein [Planctomycetales bacterium]
MPRIAGQVKRTCNLANAAEGAGVCSFRFRQYPRRVFALFTLRPADKLHGLGGVDMELVDSVAATFGRRLG